jgi:hypothetical protein
MSDPHSVRNSFIHQHPWTLPQHPLLARKVTKRRCNASILHVLIFFVGLAFLSIICVYRMLKSKHVPGASTVHKNLQQFRNGALQREVRPSRIRTEYHKDETNTKRSPKDLVLTAFLEPPETLNHDVTPLPVRTTTATKLMQFTFPNVRNCSTLMQDFPIDNYPHQDPFLPWIHDMIPNVDGSLLQFVAQNRRRCQTGHDEIDTMKFWEPQISLLQRVPVVVSHTQTQQHQGAYNSTSTMT